MPSAARVLLIDDDQSHLTLYSLIVERAGHKTVQLLANTSHLDIPTNSIDVVVLDYRLGAFLKSPDVAREIRQLHPTAPILVLSDMQWMPDDIAAFATHFVRKGEPEQLLEAIAAVLNRP